MSYLRIWEKIKKNPPVLLLFTFTYFIYSGILGNGIFEVQAATDLNYTKPHPFEFITRVPRDIKEFGKNTFRKKNIPMALGIIGTTGILLLLDQHLVDKAHHIGDQNGISHTNYQKTLFSIPMGKAKFDVEGPFDSGSALYFIGDGWVTVMLAGGLLSYGAMNSDNRALQTASQMGEAILASGLIAQTLKHITGRGSPFTTGEPGGSWHFLPNQKSYAGHVATYDAFPSGHLTASMATLTVLAENYPEHQWIRPVGYSLFGLLGFQMLNNGVHWASDYPLALLLGYSFGKIASSHGHRANTQANSNLEFLPYSNDGLPGSQLTYHFSSKASLESSTSVDDSNTIPN